MGRKPEHSLEQLVPVCKGRDAWGPLFADERSLDHVPEVKVLTPLCRFAVPVTAETTVGEIPQKGQVGEEARALPRAARARV